MRIVIIIALCLHLIAPLAVWAQAAAKGPLDYSLKQYGLILGVATLGGLVSWYGKVSRGVLPPWSIHHLVGELREVLAEPRHKRRIAVTATA